MKSKKIMMIRDFNQKKWDIFGQKKWDIFGQKKWHIFVKKSDAFFVKKLTWFFSSKIDEIHFFSFFESWAYISVKRVGNFFYIEKWHFFHKISVKFPTRFPDRYLERQVQREFKLLQFFCSQKSVQKLFIFLLKKVFKSCSVFCKKILIKINKCKYY